MRDDEREIPVDNETDADEFAEFATSDPTRLERLGSKAKDLLEQAGFTDTPGVVAAASGPEALTALQELMASHRVWERFPTAIG